MMQIIQLPGTDKRLYALVAPLVMNPVVLKQNYNFPFRTSEKFVWFVAVDKRKVVGFVPVERRSKELIINNYYVLDKDPDILRALLEKVIADVDEELLLTSVTFLEDSGLFGELGFVEEKRWTRYVKMRKE